VPGGAVPCASPPSRRRYRCLYQHRLRMSLPCSSMISGSGSSTQPDGTVAGLTSAWQASLVVLSAVRAPLSACSRRKATDLSHSQQHLLTPAIGARNTQTA
jgi:hypothetical protein